MVIIDYYNSLPRGEKTEFIKKVLLATDMAHSTFFYKLQDNSFKKLEREAIDCIIQEQQEGGLHVQRGRRRSPILIFFCLSEWLTHSLGNPVVFPAGSKAKPPSRHNRQHRPRGCCDGRADGRRQQAQPAACQWHRKLYGDGRRAGLRPLLGALPKNEKQPETSRLFHLK